MSVVTGVWLITSLIILVVLLTLSRKGKLNQSWSTVAITAITLSLSYPLINRDTWQESGISGYFIFMAIVVVVGFITTKLLNRATKPDRDSAE